MKITKDMRKNRVELTNRYSQRCSHQGVLSIINYRSESLIIRDYSIITTPRFPLCSTPIRN